MITTKLNLSKLLVLLTTCLVLAVSATSDNDGNVQATQNKQQQKSTLLTYYIDFIDIILAALENLILNYFLPAYAYVKSNETIRYSLFSLIITVVVMQTLGTFNFIFKRKKSHRLTSNLQDIPADTQNMQKQIRSLREAVSLLKQQILEGSNATSQQQGGAGYSQNASSVPVTAALRIDPQIEQRLNKNQQGIEQLKQGLMKIVEIQQELQESILQSQKEVASDIASLRTGGINSSSNGSSSKIKKNNNNTSSTSTGQTAPVEAGNAGGLDSSNQKNNSYSLIEDTQVYQAQQQLQPQLQEQYQVQQQQQQQSQQLPQQFQQPQDARLSSPFSPPPQQQQQQSYAPNNISSTNTPFPGTSSSVPQQQLPQEQLQAPQFPKSDPQQEQESSPLKDNNNTNSNPAFQNSSSNHNSEPTFGRPPPPQQKKQQPAVPFGARSSPALANRRQQPPRAGGGPFTGPIPPS